MNLKRNILGLAVVVTVAGAGMSAISGQLDTPEILGAVLPNSV